MTLATGSQLAWSYKRSPASSATKRPRAKTRATLICAAALLLLAEVGLRARAYFRHGSHAPVASIYEPDELLGRRLIPGATMQGSLRNLTVNSLGYRGADFPAVKPPDVTRIAVLGDSTSFGMEASSDESVWVAQMVDHLNKSDTELKFDAINGGVPGYTLTTSSLQLQERLGQFEPNIVIIYTVGTDLSAHARRQFPDSGCTTSSKSTISRFVQKNSMLVNLVRANTAAFRSKRIVRQRHDQLDQRGINDYSERLRSLIRRARETGKQVIVCTCPRAFGDTEAPTDQHTLAASALANNPALSLEALNDGYSRYNEAIRNIAEEMNVELVDLARIVPSRDEYFADSIHLNDKGHAAVGKAVAEVVSELVQPQYSEVGGS